MKHIYGNVTKNGVEIHDMVDVNDDIIYPLLDGNKYFARFTLAGDITKEKPLKSAIAVFSYDDPWKALYGFVTKTQGDDSEGYDKEIKEFIATFSEEMLA